MIKALKIRKSKGWFIFITIVIIIFAIKFELYGSQSLCIFIANLLRRCLKKDKGMWMLTAIASTTSFSTIGCQLFINT